MFANPLSWDNFSTSNSGMGEPGSTECLQIAALLNRPGNSCESQRATSGSLMYIHPISSILFFRRWLKRTLGGFRLSVRRMAWNSRLPRQSRRSSLTTPHRVEVTGHQSFPLSPSSTLALSISKALYPPQYFPVSPSLFKNEAKRVLMVSSVAQGKKPATSATATTPTSSSRKTSASHPPTSAATTKSTPGRTDHQPTRQLQKRVLPSRSRRGGPGLGSVDVDTVILDAQKRKCAYFSSESISIQIPPVVPFRVGAVCVITIAPPSTRVLCAVTRLVYSPICIDYLV